jgi:cobalt-zinc-cadmium efflux system outer membrane protein
MTASLRNRPVSTATGLAALGICLAVTLHAPPSWAQIPAAPKATPLAAPLQESALAGPAASHPQLVPADVQAPPKTDGGPGMPQPQDLPENLSLDEALKIFRARGFALLIQDAAVVNAEGVEKAATFVPNPQLNLGYGRVLPPYSVNSLSCTTSPTGSPQPQGCSADQFSVGLSDNFAIEDSLTGKRHLRMKVARAALAAARLNRIDAQRTLEFQLKSAYYTAVQAQAAYDFAKEVQQASDQAMQINQERLTGGKINEGDFERIHSVKLEADQSVDAASQALRQAKVAVAFFLGVRGRVPEFNLFKDTLNFLVPQPIAAATPEGLVREAFSRRPDLLALGYQGERAAAAIALAKRQRVPDVALSAQYTQTGTGQSAIQPPTISFGLTGNLPIFYQQQGEILQAQADLTTQLLTRGQTTAQVVSEVETAYAAYLGSRMLVERMEGALLQSARRALEITKLQWLAGKANLTDYLDARRSDIATHVEYLQDLANYWTAVAQLEEAVGVGLRP